MPVPARLALTASALAAGGLLSTALVAGPATAGDGGRPATARLTGAAEVPEAGDPDGVGTASVRVNPGRRQLCFSLSVSGIEPATAAHLHRAPAGVAGPVVVPLTPPTDGSSRGCREVSRELAQQILRNPAAFYVNVHNAEFPAGALRGQLRR